MMDNQALKKMLLGAKTGAAGLGFMSLELTKTLILLIAAASSVKMINVRSNVRMYFVGVRYSCLFVIDRQFDSSTVEHSCKGFVLSRRRWTRLCCQKTALTLDPKRTQVGSPSPS